MENGRRGRLEPEFELLDTGVFDEDRYWVVEVDYAKAGPTDLLMTVGVTNAGPERDTLHVLPTCGGATPGPGIPAPPRRCSRRPARRRSAVTDHPFLGDLELLAGPGPDGTAPTLLFCDNETNTARLYGSPAPPYPKDGINDHVVAGAATVNPELRRQQVRGVVPVHGGAGPDGRAAAAAAPGGRPGRPVGDGFDAGARPAPRRGRRVLRRAHARPPPRRTRRW